MATMPLGNKAQHVAKKEEVADLQQRFDASELVVITRNKGLTMKEVTTLRNSLRKEGASYKVAKNTLVRRAIEGTRYEGLKDVLTGPTAIATSKDPIAAARIVYNFTKTNDRLEIVGGASATGMMDVERIKYLATLPSLDGLRGKIIGILQAPGAQIARVVNAYATKDSAGEQPAA
jgi:large subunit ribosomal protein L10